MVMALTGGAFGKRLNHDSEVPRDGNSVLIKENSEFPNTSTMGEHKKKSVTLKRTLA